MLKLETRSVFMEHFLNKETQKIYVNISTFMTDRQKPAKIQIGSPGPGLRTGIALTLQDPVPHLYIDQTCI